MIILIFYFESIKMSSCPICYDQINDSSKYITSCNHIFHRECINNWISFSEKNPECPYCRNKLNLKIIKHKNSIKNKVYITKNIRRKTCIVNDIPVSFIKKQLQDQIPKAWINSNKSISPLYQLEINLEKVYISSFLRSYLLLCNKKNIPIIKKNDFLNNVYYDLDDYCILTGVFNNTMFNLVFDWCYDVINEMKNRYNILYHQFYNTILHDLSIDTMINMRFEYSKHMYQAIYTCSMYTLIHKFNTDRKKEELPNLEIFIIYTDNTYTETQLLPIIQYQEKYLENNIRIL